MFTEARLQIISRILKNWKGNFSEAGVARTLKKLRTSKEDYCIKYLFSTIMSLNWNFS